MYCNSNLKEIVHMISVVIHCFIATVHTLMFPETAIRAVTILNNKLETREINNKLDTMFRAFSFFLSNYLPILLSHVISFAKGGAYTKFQGECMRTG